MAIKNIFLSVDEIGCVNDIVFSARKLPTPTFQDCYKGFGVRIIIIDCLYKARIFCIWRLQSKLL